MLTKVRIKFQSTSKEFYNQGQINRIGPKYWTHVPGAIWQNSKKIIWNFKNTKTVLVEMDLDSPLYGTKTKYCFYFNGPAYWVSQRDDLRTIEGKKM